ncbi:hypothetical protein ACOMHN_059398 [Nucella lapillus]
MSNLPLLHLLPFPFLLLLLNLVHLPTVTRAQSAENFNTILQKFPDIDKQIRPVRNISTRTTVTVSFNLMSIVEFNTVEQKLVSNGYFIVMWDNEYTTWNPFTHGNAWTVAPPPDKVWRPMLTVKNTMRDMKPLGEDYTMITTYFNGTTVWYPAERLETFCAVDVTYFPFDVQKCRWNLFIWGGDWMWMDLVAIMDTINLQDYTANGEWDVRETTARAHVQVMNNLSYPTLEFEVTLRRRPTLLAMTVLLPVLVLAVVNVFVFTIPSETGERLAYSMTSLLSFGVFMSFIMDAMPSSSLTLSIVAINMSCLLVMSSVYVLCCILSLRLFHRDESKHSVPTSLQSVIVWLEILVCLDPPASNKVMNVYQIPTPMLTVDLPGVGQTGVGADARACGHNNNNNIKLRGQLDKWAKARNRNHAAYTDPAEMTWRRVSRTVDTLLFRFFLSLVFSTNSVVWLILIINYYG